MFYFQILPPDEIVMDNMKYQKSKYKPQIVALAEGFKSKNLVTGCNINYYVMSADDDKPKSFLLQKRDFNVANVSALIVGLDCLLAPDTQTYDRMTACKAAKKPVVVFDWIASRFFATNPCPLLDRIDTYYFYAYISACDIYEPKVKPWPIGFTNRVVEMCNKYNTRPFSLRKDAVLWSHRVPHHVRKAAWDRFYLPYLSDKIVRFNDGFEQPAEMSEYDTMMSYQTGNRHNPKFYESLCSVKMFDCCGGFFIGNGTAIKQWDSYKLWEGFVAGCCVISLDFEHYGFKFGSNPFHEPRNMIHYIGLKLEDKDGLEKLANDIKNGKVDLETIANNGRKWAIENYSPESCAGKFIADNFSK